MAHKLIVIKQEYLIECDYCEYKIMNIEQDPHADISRYVNRPCPWCSENLLTEKDYQQYQKTLRIINWLNKWFSWLTIFNSKYSKGSIKVFNGVKIKIEDGTGK